MRIPRVFKNQISLIGAYLSLCSAIGIISLLIICRIFGESLIILNLMYYFFPILLVMGLIMIPFGAHKNKGKVRVWLREDKWPVIDLNKTGVRNVSLIFILGTIVLLLIVVILSVMKFL